jgi:hypothetical protein
VSRSTIRSRAVFDGAVLALAASGCTTVVVQVTVIADAGAPTDAGNGSAYTADATSGSPSADAGSTVDATLADASATADASLDWSAPVAVDAGMVANWANWPMPNPQSTGLPHPQVYDTTTAGIVKDVVTQLQWQAASDGITRTWADAIAYCAALPDFGGGWRLPSRIELFSIVDYTTVPGISAAGFGALPTTDSGSLVFWSASLKAGDNTQAWAVDFGSGVDLVFPKPVTAAFLVRCVRGD